MEAADKPPIEEVLAHYGAVIPHYAKERGQKFSCFTHDDKNPSAVYNKDRNTWRCFSCGRGSDSWGLIMEEEGIDFKEATAFAEERGWTSGGDLPGGALGRRRSGGSLLSSGGASLERRVDRSVRLGRGRRTRRRS